MLKRATQLIGELFGFRPERIGHETEVVNEKEIANDAEVETEVARPVPDEKPLDTADIISNAIKRMHGRNAIGMRLVSEVGQQITVIRPVNTDGMVRLGILSHGIPPRIYSHREELFAISRVRSLMERGTWVVEKGEAHKELLRRAGVKRKAFVSSLDDIEIQAKSWSAPGKDDTAPKGPKP